MATDEISELKAKFVKMFASVPIPLREEIIATVDNKPVSWSAAYVEIQKGSKEGEVILNQLKKMGVL